MRVLTIVATMALTLNRGSEAQDCASNVLAPHLTVSETDQRILHRVWPSPPSGASMEGYAIIEIKVSSDGALCKLHRIGGHPMILGSVEQVLKRWTFRKGEAFIGLIVVRYSAAGYELL